MRKLAEVIAKSKKERAEIDADADPEEELNLIERGKHYGFPYTFANWTENGNVVSTNPNYTFTVTGNRTLVANFAIGSLITTDSSPLTGGSTAILRINPDTGQQIQSDGTVLRFNDSDANDGEVPQLAAIARLTRGALSEALDAPWIRTARAKGLPEHLIVLRHALKPALLPVLSWLGPAAAGLMTGSVVVEQVFGIPGIGRYFVQGALNRDYTLVLGVVLFYGALVIAFNFLVDLAYGALDPRARPS